MTKPIDNLPKYQFIKSKLRIAEELHQLWDNYPLYKFMNGAQWVRKRELDIAECLLDRDDWIEVCRTVWQQRQEQLESKTKNKPR
jgi:hypothetical protein